MKRLSAVTLATLLSISIVGCSKVQVSSEGAAATTEIASSTVSSELFSDRDLEQSADLSTATQMNLVSNQDVTLNKEGVYVLSGEVENVTVVIDASEEAKVQIVLDGVSITNEDYLQIM